MRAGAAVPQVSPQASLAEAVLAISKGGLGMTAVVDAQQRIQGIFTDGDLRRAFERDVDLKSVPVTAVMTANPRCIGVDKLAVEAVEMMERHKINQLLVADSEGRLQGALNMHDLFQAKVI